METWLFSPHLTRVARCDSSGLTLSGLGSDEGPANQRLFCGGGGTGESMSNAWLQLILNSVQLFSSSSPIFFIRVSLACSSALGGGSGNSWYLEGELTGVITPSVQ